MLSFALVFSILVAVNCSPLYETVNEEMNRLTDPIIAELRNKENIKVEFPAIEDIVVKSMPSLKREGNCEKADKDHVLTCKLVSDQVKATFEGRDHQCTLRFVVQVTVDEEGHLKSWEINETDIIFEDNTTDDEYYGWIKKHLKHLKHAVTKIVKEAVHVVIEKKVKEIVTSIALSVLK